MNAAGLPLRPSHSAPISMRLLFIKPSLNWPRTTGHDVHCFEMMRTLIARGHEVMLLTEEPPPSRALEGLTLAGVWSIGPTDGPPPVTLSYLQERFRRYWGIAPERLARVRAVVEAARAEAVVAVGLETLPYLGAVTGPVRVWYAADEWVWHHLSQVAAEPAAAWAHLRAAIVKGLCERAFAPAIDRVWVVSSTEQRAMRWVTGVRAVDVVPNGVDAEAFAPLDEAPIPDTVVFWGRLSFAPNATALRWFCTRVWPLVRAEVPQATFTILGSDPPDATARLAGRDGIVLLPNLPDLRRAIAPQALVVLPFVSGGGIKNKLLEAAAMAKAIVATPKALLGLRTPPPVVAASNPRDFARAIISLWAHPDQRRALGMAARQWVAATHTWEAAADQALQGLEASRRVTLMEPGHHRP